MSSIIMRLVMEVLNLRMYYAQQVHRVGHVLSALTKVFF